MQLFKKQNKSNTMVLDFFVLGLKPKLAFSKTPAYDETKTKHGE